jgi:serine/threonine protein kinase/Flp pilus assembly protein TadD
MRVDQAHAEFFRRRAAGEALDAEAFCRQQGDLAAVLKNILSMELYLEECPHLFGDAAPIRWPGPGEKFLDFDLLLQLGKGSTARVFLAAELSLGNRLVAVKISHRGGAEAKILGPISHPNIVSVHSIRDEESSELTVVCMPYLGGATLVDVLDRLHTEAKPWSSARIILDAVCKPPHPLESRDTKEPAPLLQNGTYVDGIRLLGAQLADALAYLHERRIFHLDLKLSNVLMTPDGTPMILDFNLSADPDRLNRHVGGTLPYMSPEQLKTLADIPEFDPARLDARSDIFSLGVILYLLLSGEHPFESATLNYSVKELRPLLLERQRGGPFPLRRRNPGVDRSLEHLIRRCLAFDPAERPQSAAEVAAELRQGLTRRARTRRFLSRYPRMVAASLVTLLLLAAMGIALWQNQPPYSQRQYDLGIQLCREQRFPEAVKRFDAALDAEPVDAAAILFARGWSYQQLARTDKRKYQLAIADLQEADKLAPSGRTKACLGYCLNRNRWGETAVARVNYEMALETGFANAETFNNLAYCQIGNNEYELALKNLNESLRLRPGFQPALHNRAVASIRLMLRLSNALASLSHGRPLALEQKVKRQAEISRHLDAAMQDIESALTGGSPDGELHYNAASIYAVAAQSQTRRLDVVRQHLTAAGNQNFNLQNVPFDPFFAPLVKGFKLPANNPAAQPPETHRLVDPMPELNR